ncbi:DNA polymerase [Hasllibacter halocynthiae]|uniref:Type-4 uracil-DNA glycosylase n=1 Tax=Hasllibacter halocynthiae TaxID=595589 RepID=A0A2T0X3X8_9RHOB|nr:uracil-DNA glycosylase [Hasllibacter halocynthiae]PRY93605.1 DNA polymerase [Hasllibacter halocynthiae]
MEPEALDPATARALLEWQAEMGVTDAIGEEAVDRYALEAAPPPAAKPTPVPGPEGDAKPAPAAPPASPVSPASRTAPALDLGLPADPVAEAEAAAGAAGDLAALRAAIEAFPHIRHREGARRIVFSGGTPGAPLMIVGEAPGRDEDVEGEPFVGVSGQLLDRMLGAIGRDRRDPGADRGVYLTNVQHYRPPGNATPEPEEVAMLAPFLRRHIALAAPRIVVAMGNTPLRALTGQAGITRRRGTWIEDGPVPVMPTFHPAYLLRRPEGKAGAWADLQAIRDRLAAG